MPRKIGLFIATLSVLLVVQVADAQDRPLNPKIDSMFPTHPSNYLTDLAHIVKDSNAVNGRLAEIRKNDKLSLVVVTMPTVGDRDFRDVSREIGRAWKVATKNDTLGAVVGNTGGVILLVTDIRKCRIEVARGSESYMTDFNASQECRFAAPLFKAGNFGAGFLQIANAFAGRHRAFLAANTPVAITTAPSTPRGPFPWGGFSFLLLFVGSVIALTMWRTRVRERERAKAELEARKRRAAVDAENLRLWKIEQAKRDAEDAIRREAERVAQIERNRLADIARKAAEEKERARRAALTPAQRKAEDDLIEARRVETARLAAIAAQQRREQEKRDAEARRIREANEAAAAVVAAEARRRQREEEEENSRRRSSYSSSSDSGSSSSSSSSDSSSSWDSGGSSGFDGGGGDSSY